MNLNEEFQEAKEWVENSLDMNANITVNHFETTIRMLGGLLSAYHLSNEEVFLKQATDLGNRLVKVFDTKSGIPYLMINLK